MVAVVVFFLLGGLLGLVLPTEFKLVIVQAAGEKFDTILAGATTPWLLTWRIFINNLIVTLLLYGLGFTVALPLFIIIGNGVIIGIFLDLFYRLDALLPGTFAQSLVTLIPHGVFELSAFFLASVFSMLVTIKAVWHRLIEPHKLRRQVLLESLLRFVIVIIPLLASAAVIEVYGSNQLADRLIPQTLPNNPAADVSANLKPKFLLSHHCLPNTTAAPTTSTITLSDSLVATTRIVYTPATYTLLQSRSAVPSWEQIYQCDDNLTIAVQSWPTADWTMQQARQLIDATLRVTSKNFDWLNTTQAIIHDASQPYTVGLIQTSTATVMITSTDPTIALHNVIE